MCVIRLAICLLLFVFISHWKSGVSSKIPISKCLTQYGFEGFCRQTEECVGVQTFDVSNCPRNFVCCARGELSQRKCYQYAELVFASDTGLSLMAHNHPTQKVDTCAIVAVPLIVGGEKARQKEFPHQVLLGYGDPKTIWECGGTLISENFVLTAAHCVLPNHRPRLARFGITNLQQETDNEQIYPVEDIIIHPNHNEFNRKNDIALVKLATNVEFTPYVRPACLDYIGVIEENRAIATGFGVVGHAGKQSPDLLKVTLDILEKKVCYHTVRSRNREGLINSQICAGVLAGGKDTCQGDSGGPLQTIKQAPYCMYSIIGVTSFGSMCGFMHSPAIYTRVWSYIPWIEALVWPNEH